MRESNVTVDIALPDSIILITELFGLLVVVDTLVKLLHYKADACHDLVQVAVILEVLQGRLEHVVRLLEVGGLAEDVGQLIQRRHNVLLVSVLEVLHPSKLLLDVFAFLSV